MNDSHKVQVLRDVVPSGRKSWARLSEESSEDLGPAQQVVDLCDESHDSGRDNEKDRGSTDSVIEHLKRKLHTSSSNSGREDIDGSVHNGLDTRSLASNIEASALRNDGVICSSNGATRQEVGPVNILPDQRPWSPSIEASAVADQNPVAPHTDASRAGSAQDHTMPNMGIIMQSIVDQYPPPPTPLGCSWVCVPVSLGLAPSSSCDSQFFVAQCLPPGFSWACMPNTEAAPDAPTGNHKIGDSAPRTDEVGLNTKREENRKRKYAGTPKASGSSIASQLTPNAKGRTEEKKHEGWKIKRGKFVDETRSSEDYKLVREQKDVGALAHVAEAAGVPAPGTPDPTDMSISKRVWEDLTKTWRCSIRECAMKIREEDQAAVGHLQALGFSKDQALAAYLTCNRSIRLAANHLLDNM